MHIHFVCTGNAYRSRLAEAYCKSIVTGQGLVFDSSGIGAAQYRLGNGPICWYAMRLMKRKNLISFMSWSERQTTKEILSGVNLLVCMSQSHLDFCQDKLGYQGDVELWDIPDLGEMDGFVPSSVAGIDTDINHIRLSEKTYDIIIQKCDDLIARKSR